MQMRFDPFRDLAARPGVPMDAVRHGDHVEVRFDLPGFAPADVDLQVERNVLRLTAERSWAPAEGEQVLAAERRQGKVSRQLFLGDNLDGSRVEAAYENGVLTMTIPVAETAKPKKVEIASSVSTEPVPAAAN